MRNLKIPEIPDVLIKPTKNISKMYKQLRLSTPDHVLSLTDIIRQLHIEFMETKITKPSKLIATNKGRDDLMLEVDAEGGHRIKVYKYQNNIGIMNTRVVSEHDIDAIIRALCNVEIEDVINKRMVPVYY